MSKYLISLIFLSTIASASEPNNFIELVNKGDVLFKQGDFRQNTQNRGLDREM